MICWSCPKSLGTKECMVYGYNGMRFRDSLGYCPISGLYRNNGGVVIKKVAQEGSGKKRVGQQKQKKGR